MNLAPDNRPLDLDLQLVTDAANLPDSTAFSVWAQTALDVARSPRRALSIRIVDADGIRRLNRDFRGQDRVTNILSFSFEPIVDVEEDWLGDLVICASVVAHEAQQQQKPLIAHWAHIVVHGVLHLCGFDHEEEEERRQMESLEVQLLDRLGYPNPY